MFVKLSSILILKDFEFHYFKFKVVSNFISPISPHSSIKIYYFSFQSKMDNFTSSPNYILNDTSALLIPILQANGQKIYIPYFYIPTTNGTQIQQISSHGQWFGPTPNMTETQLNEELIGQRRALEMDVQRVGQIQHPSHVLVLCLIIFGLVGNLLTAGVLFFTDLIRSNANKYILTIVLADSAYLLCALADLVSMRSGSFWICAFIEWTANSAIYVSAICIVLLTIERFLAIVSPIEHFQIAGLNRWLVILICILPFLIWQFLLMLKTTVDTSEDYWDKIVHRCAYLATIPYAGMGSLVSNTFHYILPLICVLFLNAIIAFKVSNASTMNFLTGYIAQPKPIEMSERNAAASSKSKQSIYDQKIGSKRRNSSVKFPTSAEQNSNSPKLESTSTSSIRGTSSSSKIENMSQNSSNDTVKSTSTNSPSTAMPIVIFVIPIVYVLLNTPMYTIRFITDGIRDITGINYEVPMLVVLIGHYIFFANCASNSIIYAVASSIFRRKLAQIMRQSSRNLSSISQGMSITETGRRRSQNSYSMKY